MRIIIVDDHNLFREGLAAILHQEADMDVVGLVGTVKEAVDAVLRLRPDIVLMDFSLPDGTGAEATRRIIQEYPDCKVVFMTMSERDEDLLAAIRSGAVGYLMKNMTLSKLVASLRSVQQGESAISRTMTLRLMEELARTKEPERTVDPALGGLTSREQDVLAELATGKSNQEIAGKLFISENTVKYHVHSILEKLNLHDRKEAARFAKEHGVQKKE
jgi:two-component system nitrate/nitrite response regulator NarL